MMSLLRNIKPRLPIVLLLALIVAITASACSSGEEENNDNANQPDAVTPFKSPNVFVPSAAPDFTLTDHVGREIKLTTLRGKPVVLTFIYTNCPDVCPIITAKLNQTLQLLGPDASKVEIVAITVDPERDTPARAKQFSEQQGIGDKWHFLTADSKTLQPVWDAYGVYQQREKALSEQQGTPHPDDGYTVAHSAPVYVIDKLGDKRLAYGGFELLPEDLVHDLRLLF